MTAFDARVTRKERKQGGSIERRGPDEVIDIPSKAVDLAVCDSRYTSHHPRVWFVSSNQSYRVRRRRRRDPERDR